MKKKQLRTIQLKAWQSVLLALLMILGITYAALLLQPGTAAELHAALLKNKICILLNALPVAAVFCLLYVLIGSVFWTGGITWLVFLLGSYGNYLKVAYRQDPLVFADLMQISEALTAVSDFDIQLNTTVLLGIALVTLCFAIGGVVCKDKKRGVRSRLLLLGCVLALSVVADRMLYNADEYAARNIYYNKIEKTDDANHVLTSEEVGFIYYFCYSHNRYGFQRPENYSEALVTQSAKAYGGGAEQADAESPHVIMVMLEAFSDISNGEMFSFAADEDPMKSYNLYAASQNAVSGKLIVPNDSAGTANTEFDVLTGVQTKMVADGSIPFFSIHKDRASIASVLASAGYRTVFTHPGHNWYYNRQNVYRALGFDELYFSEAYDGAETVGTLVSDRSVGDFLINRFEENRECGEQSIFEFAVTIQNHMPYTKGRYGDEKSRGIEVPASVELSEGGREQLGIYLDGVKAGDRLIGQLIEYFRSDEESVILVFFGDHLPSLGEDYAVYRELGMSVGRTDSNEDILLAHETPYLIYANEQAMRCESVRAAMGGGTQTISANYLGAALLELLGFSRNDAYFDFLCQSRHQVSGLWGDIAVLPDDEGYRTAERSGVDAEIERIWTLMECWGYSRIH